MKKKVALSATAIAVLASAVPAQVAPVQAEEPGNTIYVNSTDAGNQNDGGTGSETNPYKQLSTAVTKAKDGDTIIVIGEGYVNDIWNGNPWYIDKDITIKGQGSVPPTISVRTPGIILGGNVTFENVALGLANKSHDAIFANGHELNLINVSRAQGTRQVDLFAGGLSTAVNSYTAGNSPVINVITNNQFVGTINGQSVYSEFGGIYAGSMNGTYDKSAKIKLSNTGSTGILKVSGVYASGAWEANPGTMLDTTEPALPQADPNTLVNYGDVEFTLENVNPTVNGNTGTNSTTTLKSVGKNFTSINSNNIDNLELDGTTFTISQNILSNGLSQLTLGPDAILDLTNYEDEDFNIGTYKGTGGIALQSSNSTLNITNDVTSENSLVVYLKNYNKFTGYNGAETINQPYVTTPNNDASIVFFGAENLSKKYSFLPVANNGRYQWMVADPTKLPATPDVPEEEELEILGFEIDSENATKSVSFDEFNEGYSYPSIRYPFKVKTNLDDVSDLDLWLTDHDLEVTVNGLKAEYRPDSDDFYVASLGMVLYFEPDYEPDVQELVITSQDENGALVALNPKTYNINVSLGAAELDATLVVEGGQQPPAPPEGGDGEEPEGGEVPPGGDGDDQEQLAPTLTGIEFTTTTVREENYSSYTTDSQPEVYYQFIPEIEGEVPSGVTLDYFEPTITVGKHTARLVKENSKTYYRVDELNLNIEFKPSSPVTNQDMLITFTDEDGQLTEPTQRLYEFTISKGDFTSQTLSLAISNFPTVEDPEPEVTKPTIKSFGKAEYSATDLSTKELVIPFTVDIDNAPQETIPFNELEGAKVFSNGEEWDYNGGYYYNLNTNLILVIEEGEEVGHYTAIVKHSRLNEYLDEGECSFTLGTGDIQTVLNYTLEPSLYQLSLLTEPSKMFEPADFLATGAQQPFFKFGVYRTGNSIALDTYEDFEVSINGVVTTKQQESDGKVYYVDPIGMVSARIDYIAETDSYSLVLQTFDGDGATEPTLEQYVVELSHPSVDTLTFTANVDKEEPPAPPTEEPDPTPPATQPAVTEVLVISMAGNAYFKQEEEYDLTYHVLITTEGNLEVDVDDFNFTLDGAGSLTAKGNGVYAFEDTGMTLTVTKDEVVDNKFLINIKGQDLKLPLGQHYIYVGVNGHDAKDSMFLNLSQATLKVLEVEETTTVTEEIDSTRTNVKIPVNMKLNGRGAFHELGYNLTLNGKPLQYEVGTRYLDPSSDLFVDFVITEDAGLEVILLRLDSETSQLLPLAEGEYVIEATSDKFADFTISANLKVKEPTTDPVDPDPIPTPGGGDDEEEPTPTEPVVTDATFTTTEQKVTKGSAFVAEYDFSVTTEGNQALTSLFTKPFTFAIDGKSAEYREESDSYIIEDLGLTFRVVKLSGDNQFQLVVSGDGQKLSDGEYPITVGIKDKEFSEELRLVVEQPTQPPTPGEGGEKPTDPVDPPTPTDPPSGGDKEEEKEEPTNPPSGGGTTTEPTNPPSGGTSGGNTGGSTSGGTTTEPTNPPSGGNSGGSSSGGSGGTSGGSNTGTVTPTPPSTGGGTTLPAPDPKPEKPAEKPPVVEEQPKPTPPQQEETKPSRPTVKPNAVASAVEALEDLATTIKEKVDSLMSEIVEQAKGLILDLTGDKDDLSSVSTLEVTKDGIFANVDGEKVKFGSDLKLEDMSKLRILRADGSPVPYTTDGKSFTIDTNNFSDILITERVVEPFVDVAKGDWFQPYVDELYNRGITTGTTATTFSPNGTITRAQVAALLARAYELKPTGDKSALKDIKNQWYADDVQALVDAGIIKGYEDGTFRGDKEVTREQLVIMLQRLEEQRGKDTSVSNVPNFTDKDKMSNEGKSAIEWAASKGIVNSGKNTAFKPKGPATRAQVSKMLTQYMKR